MNTLTRRLFVHASGVAAFTSPSLASADDPAISQDNLVSPQWNLDALTRVNGAGDGGTGCWWAKGQVYGLPKDELRRPLLGIYGCRLVKYDRVQAGYNVTTRDFAFFTDLITGEVLQQFQNPFTGRTVPVRPILTRRHVWVLGPNGQILSEEYQGNQSSLVGRPFVMPWTFADSRAWANLETFIKYPTGMVGSEILIFECSIEDLLSPKVKSVPAAFTWVNESGWFNWLEMPDVPGGILMVSSGAKVDNQHALPPALKAMASRIFPGLLDDPWTWVRPSQGG